MVLLMTNFALKVKNFNPKYYSFGDSFIVIKKDKIDLMVKRSTMERNETLFAYMRRRCGRVLRM